jgi:hypothetical protein
MTMFSGLSRLLLGNPNKIIRIVLLLATSLLHLTMRRVLLPNPTICHSLDHCLGHFHSSIFLLEALVRKTRPSPCLFKR